MRFLALLPITSALLLAGCGPNDTDPGLGGVTVAEARALDEAAFPDVDAFRKLKENGQLTSPDTVGRFLAWLLLDADAAQFREHENDIRDAELARRWQGG